MVKSMLNISSLFHFRYEFVNTFTLSAVSDATSFSATPMVSYSTQVRVIVSLIKEALQEYEDT